MGFIPSFLDDHELWGSLLEKNRITLIREEYLFFSLRKRTNRRESIIFSILPSPLPRRINTETVSGSQG
jgi:hypothetical protein